MRALPLFLGLLFAVGTSTYLSADDPKPPKPSGVLLDLRGPPDPSKLPAGKFTLDFTITVEGLKESFRHSSGRAGSYDPKNTEFEVVSWGNSGYIVEKAGETQIRFVAWKDKATGRVYPVTGIKIESKDLPAEQLPKVVPDAKNKG